MRGEYNRASRWGILGILMALCVGAAYYNARGESISYPDWVIRYTLIWSVIPAAALGLYAISAWITRDPMLNFDRALTMTAISAAIYIFYAANGGSETRDPDSAGQMHLIFVPVLLCIATIPFFLVMLVSIISSVYKNRRNAANANHASQN